MSRLKLLFVTLTSVLLLAPVYSNSADDSQNGLADPEGLQSLKYRLIGPAWGGRVSRVAGVAGNPNVYFMATASGGVWKSDNGGTQWKPVFDKQPISSIGSIAVAPSDPNIVYVGSGEANIRGNVAAGNGIYKSTDGGNTWAHVWEQEGQIGTMVVHPTDADVAFAAVLGHAFGPNPERGVYRTKDGGQSWEQVLKKDDLTGASDVALDLSNPSVVFAGLWQTRRRPWKMTSGGPGSGLYLSRDGGDTWKQLSEKGLPPGIWGKVGVAVAPSDGRRVYALIEAEEGGLFRSDDGGESWTKINGSRELRQRAWYYSTITINPTNPNELWCPQVPMLRSIDVGKTFTHVHGLHHGDHHDVWIDPANPKRIIAGNDGGVDISLDGGETWYAPPLPICQFYHISVDNRVPFYVAGSLQDIGTTQGPGNSLSRAGIRNTDWYGVGGGEAGWVVSNPEDPNIVYAGEYGGYISRYDHRTRQAASVSIYPENPSGHGAEDLRYRFQWTAPIATSPHDSRVVYHAANVLFRSVDGGQSWTAISSDLTRNDKSKQKWSGGPITGDNTGVEVYDTIFAVAESPIEKGLIWAGSDDGLVHLTRDGGATWQNLTDNIPGIPEWGTVKMIEPSRYTAGAAYLVVDTHRFDDMTPYLYKTEDYGQSWTRLDTALPRDVYLHAVREDKSSPGLIYLGTERGVAFSKDDGQTWNSLRLNLPTVAVHDLQVTGDSLVLGTNGRSAWILDDLTPLRDLTPTNQEATAHLFPPAQTIRWRYHDEEKGAWSGENPPNGVLIYYWLREKPTDEIVLEIYDEDGKLVRTLSSKQLPLSGSSEYEKEENELLEKWVLPAEQGLNRAVWDLNWTGADMIKGAIIDYGFPLVGPMAVPGTYQLRLKAGGQVLTTDLKLVSAPNQAFSNEELGAQLGFALQVRNTITDLTKTGHLLQSIQSQLKERNRLLAENEQAKGLIEASNRLIPRLDDLEARIHNPNAQITYDVLAMKGGAQLYSRLAPLLLWINQGDTPPTQGAREVFESQAAELDKYKNEIGEVIDSDLRKLNEEADRLNLPVIYIQ